MATGGDQTIELVEENLPTLFYDIRVDHLNEDELEYELEIRDILFAREDSMSRKRRALREKIKCEKEERKGGDRTLKRNPLDEFRCCEGKLRELEEMLQGATKDLPPRCQSILLHLGNRAQLLRQCVGPDMQSQIDGMQIRILRYLDQFFYNKRQERHNWNADIGLENLFDEPQNRVSIDNGVSTEIPQSNRRQNAPPSDTDSDILGCLVRLGLLEGDKADPEAVRNGLLKLENELYLLRNMKPTTHSNLVNMGTSSPECQVTYTGTIPKSSGSREASLGNHVRISEPVGLAQWPRPSPAVSMPSLYSWGTSCPLGAMNSHSSGGNFYHFPTYPSISTQTNPTLSNTVPRVMTSAGPSASYTRFPETFSGRDYTIPNTKPTEWNVGYDPTAYRSSLSADGWKVMPYTSVTTVASSYSHAPSLPTAQNPMIQVPLSRAEPIPASLPASNPTSFGVYPSAPVSSIIPPVVTTTSVSFLPANPIHFAYNRKSLPVSKWKVDKYAGTDQGLKLNEFLHLVSQLALSEHVSEMELFDSAFHLFTGPALSWYMSNRSAGRLANWNHLVAELRKTFAHPELDSLVRAKIYQRRQQRSETFQNFYYEMEGMFRSMIHPMTEGEKLEVLRRNMRFDYKKALLWKPIASLAELLDAGHQIDASNFSLFAKAFGTEASVNAVSSGIPNREGNKPRSQNHYKSQEKVNFKDREGPPQKREGAAKADSKAASTPNQSGRPENPREGTSNPSRTLQFLVEGYRPPRGNECLYCRQTNHNLDQCRSYKGSICLVCGFRGFETQNCPFCKKNGLQMVENRRPSNPNPNA